MGPPEAPDHLPLGTLPFLPEQCNHCGKNFKKGSLSTCWCSIEPAVSKKYCKTEIWLSCRHTKGSATLFSRRGSPLGPINKGAHLLATGSAGVEDRFVRKIMLSLDRISVGGQSTREREGSPL